MGGAEADLVGELRRLAGVGDVDGFVVEAAPHPFEVRYFSGSASHLRFVARYDAVARADHDAAARPAGAGSYRRSGRGGLVAVRPLAITLRRERSDDVEAKRKGVNVEHQTGDDDFDRNVYVSTPTADPEVLSAVLGPKLRSGVLALLDLGFQYVAIDDRDGDVEAYLSAFVERNPRPGRGEKAVAAFALVLSDLPAITASGGAHPRPPFWARGVTLGVVWIASGVLGPFASCYV
ncbi:MAG TPA: hypothetical protein VHB21_21275, partial [Minicystis sp.]|nr:hypothetical protein [Minicystis sp.]